MQFIGKIMSSKHHKTELSYKADQKNCKNQYVLLAALGDIGNAENIKICGNKRHEKACRSIFTTKTKPDYWCPALIEILNF